MDDVPSPEKGPPFSANAVRDRSQLPIQISCIVGAYILAVIILGTLLLTLGRRMRKQALAASLSQPTSAKEPFVMSLVGSPPRNDRKWYNARHPRKGPGSVKSVDRMISPGIGGVAPFDATTLELDRQKRQDELEMLYTAALEHDEVVQDDALRSDTVLVDENQDLDATAQQQSQIHETRRASTTRPRPRPDMDDPRPTDSPTVSPVSFARPSRLRGGGPSPQNMDIMPAQPTSGLPVIPKVFSRRVKRVPMQIVITEEHSPSDPQCRGPRTPITYTSRRREGAARERDSDLGMTVPSPSPMTPHFQGSLSYPRCQHHHHQSWPPHAVDQQGKADTLSPLHNRYERQTGSSPCSILFPPVTTICGLPQSPRSPFHAPQTPAQPSGQQQRQEQTISSVGTFGTLPLRRAGPLSPVQTQTATFLERSRGVALPSHLRATQQQDLSTAERTGLYPASMVASGGPVSPPYSLYHMPFMPLTPVTPRLVTRADRERARREEGRRAVTAEDAVGEHLGEDGEVWGM